MDVRNLRNPRIAQCKLGIHTLARNRRIAQPIPLLRTRDGDTSIASYKIPRSISNAESLRLASHQSHSSVFIVIVDCQNL